jgi:hypothetical protein
MCQRDRLPTCQSFQGFRIRLPWKHHRQRSVSPLAVPCDCSDRALSNVLSHDRINIDLCNSRRREDPDQRPLRGGRSSPTQPRAINFPPDLLGNFPRSYAPLVNSGRSARE